MNVNGNVSVHLRSYKRPLMNESLLEDEICRDSIYIFPFFRRSQSESS